MRTHENDGFYKNEKTGKKVYVYMTLHHIDEVEICFRGTRDGKPFGRAFGDTIEKFMSRHSFITQTPS